MWPAPGRRDSGAEGRHLCLCINEIAWSPDIVSRLPMFTDSPELFLYVSLFISCATWAT